jgi:hypothetical protein
MEVRYEDLTARPEQYMRSVCDFLLVEFDERVLLAGRSRQRMPGRQSKTIVVNQRGDADTRSIEDPILMDRIAGKQLACLGYATEYPDGDFNPALPRLLWWFVHDGLAIFARQLWEKLTFQKRMTWSLYFARLRATIRQARHSALGGHRHDRQ